MKRKVVCIILSLLLLGIVFGCKPAEEPVEQVEQEKHEIHWGYEGEGAPAHWGSLKPEYATCGSGLYQSPIDINKTITASLDKLVFSYKESPLRIINNGHSIQINYEPGSSVTIDGQTYELLQFHFHAPSEHTVKGAFYDMEMHLVHKNSKDELAVVGVMLKKGAPNNIIQVLWDNIPAEVNQESTVNGISVNASGLLPADTRNYHYFGSLTTPPCSEGVNWSVLKTPIEVSEEQIAKFRSVMGVDNNRPVLPVNKRFVLSSQ
jgi:carbonic anhydrase